MVRFYYYNDIGEFKKPACKVKTKVSSNLCTFYYSDKNRFCGNYCSRKCDKFNNRCWRHKVVGPKKPAVVLLMISSSERFYNRDIWLKFLTLSEQQGANFQLVIYHEDMLNCTVRQPNNLLSRFRPFPDVYGNVVLPLKDRHGSMNFAQVYMQMLKYGCKIPHAARCVHVTERTIPIRSPAKIYNQLLASKCHLNTSYNVAYSRPPPGLPDGLRKKPFAAVNNLAQGLYTVEFLNKALPTLSKHCDRFGISYNNKRYTVTNNKLYDNWRSYTGSNLTEFWLLNSFLLDIQRTCNNPIKELKRYMEPTRDSDIYTVAEVPQWRNDWKRTYVFNDYSNRKEFIPWFDIHVKRYYRGLDINRGVTLKQIIRYLRKYKKRALFFRQVEL